MYTQTFSCKWISHFLQICGWGNRRETINVSACGTPELQHELGIKKGDIPLQDHVNPRVNKRQLHTARKTNLLGETQQQSTHETKVGENHTPASTLSSGSTGTSIPNGRREYELRNVKGQIHHIRRSKSSSPVVQVTDYSTLPSQRSLHQSSGSYVSACQPARLTVARSQGTVYRADNHIDTGFGAVCTDSAYHSEGAWKMIDSACSDYDFTRKLTPPHIAVGRGITDSCQQYVFH